MNFTLDDTQQALADLAAQVLTGHGGHERARAAELGTGFDAAAWQALGATGLLDALSRGEGGVIGAGEVAAALGHRVVSVPAYALLTALLVADTLGLAPDEQERLRRGELVITLALPETGLPDPAAVTTRWAGGTLTGSKPLVPAAGEAGAALVAAIGPEGPGLFAVELAGPGVSRTPLRTTDRCSAARLDLDGAPARRVGDAAALSRVEQIATVLACAAVIGLGRGATEGAASYITGREQFGRPIASFQAPVLRLADAHIDLSAMTVTMQQAAWQLDQGRDAQVAVSVAKWWSAQGGHRVLHTAQHLHGGLGADIEYPAHRYFLRGKQLLDTLGGAAWHASRLGAALAAEAQQREGMRG